MLATINLSPVFYILVRTESISRTTTPMRVEIEDEAGNEQVVDALGGENLRLLLLR